MSHIRSLRQVGEGSKLPVRDVVIMEQMFLGVPEEMAVWLKERKLESLEKLGKLADDYILARKNESGGSKPASIGNRQDTKCIWRNEVDP